VCAVAYQGWLRLCEKECSKLIRHVGSYDVTVKPTVRNYSNSSRVEFIPRVDPPVNSEDLIRQIVHKVLVWHIILGTDLRFF
jgi:hypothetical protein